MTNNLRFSPSFQSFVDTSFFHELSRLKLEVLGLDSKAQALHAVLDFNSMPSSVVPLFLKNDSFDKEPSNGVTLRGFVSNFNTIEDFKSCDKMVFLKERAQELFTSAMNSGLQESIKFYMLCFADLKQYKYYYWICMPAYQIEDQTFEVLENETVNKELDQISMGNDFVACLVDNEVCSASPENLKNCQTLLFKDFSRIPSTPAVVIRNMLAVWSKISSRDQYTVLCIRQDKSSFQLKIRLKGGLSPKLKVTGWEKNGLGKLAPKAVNLSALMDPLKLSEQAVDLNLKLMKWRIAPDIDLECIKNTKVLLLGSGTLGCYVARSLLAWDTRHISFVDNSTVSFSNPVRQPLFEFSDVGKPKAIVASDALKRIFPLVNSEGYQLEIAMIGHPVTHEVTQKGYYDRLCELIQSHDAIFLLMDARESRWLPTVLGKLYGKIVINAALGFDSYLVMRHGTNEDNLGCYFCNDVVAPSDSLSDRTLDQMCTVTRPGVATMAASQAVELLVSSLQKSEETLGPVPHQIRGFLHDFKTIKVETPCFSNCSACSPAVIDELRKNGWNFVKSALNDYKIVEDLCGLSKVQQAADMALENDFSFSDDDELITA